MIFYLLYFLFMTVTFIALPYIVSHYILAGDVYLLVTTGIYFNAWLLATVFIVSYALNMTNHLYYCLTSQKSNNIFDYLRSLHGSTVATFYSSVYITLFAFVGYLVGITAMESIPQLKKLLVSVIHLPGFEFFLKGVPLSLGGLIGHALSSICVSPQCGGGEGGQLRP